MNKLCTTCGKKLRKEREKDVICTGHNHVITAVVLSTPALIVFFHHWSTSTVTVFSIILLFDYMLALRERVVQLGGRV